MWREGSTRGDCHIQEGTMIALLRSTTIADVSFGVRTLTERVCSPMPPSPSVVAPHPPPLLFVFPLSSPLLPIAIDQTMRCHSSLKECRPLKRQGGRKADESRTWKGRTSRLRRCCHHCVHCHPPLLIDVMRVPTLSIVVVGGTTTAMVIISSYTILPKSVNVRPTFQLP